jgi:hypothetical protein
MRRSSIAAGGSPRDGVAFFISRECGDRRGRPTSAAPFGASEGVMRFVPRASARGYGRSPHSRLWINSSASSASMLNSSSVHGLASNSASVGSLGSSRNGTRFGVVGDLFIRAVSHLPSLRNAFKLELRLSKRLLERFMPCVGDELPILGESHQQEGVVSFLDDCNRAWIRILKVRRQVEVSTRTGLSMSGVDQGPVEQRLVADFPWR